MSIALLTRRCIASRSLQKYHDGLPNPEANHQGAQYSDYPGARDSLAYLTISGNRSSYILNQLKIGLSFEEKCIYMTCLLLVAVQPDSQSLQDSMNIHLPQHSQMMSTSDSKQSQFENWKPHIR